MLLQVLHLANLLEDEGLARLVALDLESRTVVSTVLHALKAINEGIENVATVLLSELQVSTGQEGTAQGPNAVRALRLTRSQRKEA